MSKVSHVIRRELGDKNTLPKSGSPLIDALCQANAYPHEVASVKLIETHISWVLLTGQFAYKIKKPVNFGFLDFSTLEQRHFYCQEEIRLNRRLAKDWYLEVVSITGESDRPKMGGSGEAIEYAVKMKQFPSALTLKDKAESGQLGADEIDQIIEIVADFHGSIEQAGEQSPYGKSQDIRHWADENFRHIRPLLNDTHQLLQLEAIEAWEQNEWGKLSALMQQRKRQGFIRECHGDLHLGNMSLIDDKVIIFDCIEFNPMLRWIDVMNEVAFVVMDLQHLGYDAYAYRFLNHYLQQTGDYSGLALLRYYIVYRALVRAKVALLRKAQHPDAQTCEEIETEYTAFVNLAEKQSQSCRPRLLITHGFSGSGKSTYASQLAERIGAIHLRSDVERKRLFGYSAQAKSESSVDAGIYTREAGEQTYYHLAGLAKAVLEAGYTVIVDATFLKVNHRSLFLQLANESKVESTVIDFQAPDNMLCQRIRQRKNDPSEATIEVLRQQQKSAQPLTDFEKKFTVAIDTENENVLEKLLAIF